MSEQSEVPVGCEVVLDAYDTGLLGDGGGGDIDWWQNYIRHELERAHEFYSDQVSNLAAPLPVMTEAPVSVIARSVRQTLRDYGHSAAESSLPEIIASDVAKALSVVSTAAIADGLREALYLLRTREVQMMGAAISTRNWHDMETAYNAGRDRLDGILIEIRLAALAATPARNTSQIGEG